RLIAQAEVPEPVIEVRRGVELSHQVRRQTATSNLSARAAAQFLLIPVPCGLCCCSCAIPMRDSGVKVKMFAPVVHALADLPERAIVGFDIEARRVLGVPTRNFVVRLSAVAVPLAADVESHISPNREHRMLQRRGVAVADDAANQPLVPRPKFGDELLRRGCPSCVADHGVRTHVLDVLDIHAVNEFDVSQACSFQLRTTTLLKSSFDATQFGLPQDKSKTRPPCSVTNSVPSV